MLRTLSLPVQSPARPFTHRLRIAGLVLLAALGLSGCGYNTFQSLDEQVKAAWSEVLNQYQRRADLIPNIVATVKGEANFEQIGRASCRERVLASV